MSSTVSRDPPLSTLTTAALLTAILLAAFALRAFTLPRESAWYDELLTVTHLDAPTLWQYLERTHPRNPVPPFYMVTQYGWSRLFGDSVTALRSLSLLFALASLLALFDLTRRLFNNRAAVFATGWTTFVYWHILYAQEIRFYALTVLLALLSMLAFVRWLEHTNGPRLAVTGGVGLLMVWTHPHTLFLLVAQALFLLLARRPGRRQLLAWTGLNAVIVLSLIAFFLSINRERAYAITGWLPRPGLWGDISLAAMVADFSGAAKSVPTNAVGDALQSLRGLWSLLLVLIGVAGTIAGLVLLRRRSVPSTDEPARRPLTSRETALLLGLWLCVPPLLVFAASYLWRPMFLPRYVYYSAFPMYIALGYAFASMRRRWVAAVCFALLIGYDAAFYFPGPFRWRFEDVASAVNGSAAPVAVVYVDNMLMAEPMQYYLPSGVAVDGPLEIEKLDDDLTARTADRAKAHWMVYSLPGRFRYMTRRLDELGVNYRVHDFPAGRPLRLVEIPPRGKNDKPARSNVPQRKPGQSLEAILKPSLRGARSATRQSLRRKTGDSHVNLKLPQFSFSVSG